MLTFYTYSGIYFGEQIKKENTLATKNYTIKEELHTKFKIKCIKEKTSMSDEIRKFIERFIGDDPVDYPENEQSDQKKLNF